MSVDFQDDIGEDWDMAAALAENDSDEGAAKGAEKFSNLNQALDQAGSAIGDLHDSLHMAFRFNWHRMPIYCWISEQDGDVGLVLETDLGPLPYTLENKERRAYLKQLNDAGLELPIGEFLVTEHSRFRHRVKRTLEAPITGSVIVTSVVQLLLTARPYHELAKTG